jgi:hypothetical protein
MIVMDGLHGGVFLVLTDIPAFSCSNMDCG